jgi:hypothetical protein
MVDLLPGFQATENASFYERPEVAVPVACQLIVAGIVSHRVV